MGSCIPESKKSYIYQRAAGFCQNIKGQAHGLAQYLKTNKRVHVEHENEIHQKFSFALACLLFLFIGAPMGAIIRKGGFGWPILVAIIFFMLFFVLFLVGKNLATNLEITCWIGSWLPNLVLLPFGLFLSYKAFNDSRVIYFDKILALIRMVFSKIKP
jgi:lipopolysaccharide export system permease protein